MLAKERQEKIFSIIKNRGAITASSLTKQFGVSLETIRRDLLLMEDAGMLTRVHGGAVAKSDMKPILSLDERNSEYSLEKRMLSEKAVEFINEGDIIGIDTGSTAIIFAQVLKERFLNLTVVTHSLDVFSILSNHANFTVILCGGHFMPSENSFCGALTHNMLQNLHLQKSFIFPWALSLGEGIYDYNVSLLEVQREMMKSSSEIFILADSSKFEKKALIKTSDMRAEFVYITDTGLSDELKNLYRENGINIQIG